MITHQSATKDFVKPAFDYLSKLIETHDPFGEMPKNFDAGAILPNKSKNLKKLLPTWCWEGNLKGPYLPIEFLRDRSDLVWNDTATDGKAFKSSGTTANSKSVSRYSEDGLRLYRKSALKTFKSVIKRASGMECSEFTGYSLIPTLRDWPDSSLAQMVAWLAESMPVKYCNQSTLRQSLSKATGKPTWVFGTAFHFMWLLDQNKTIGHHDHLYLIETGGTKGRARTLPKQEFYRALQNCFQIPLRNIISEYGMCELASQAYEWGEDNERLFRFPWWVKAQVMPAKKSVFSSGEGCGFFTDPMRIDCPVPMRVQDRIKIIGENTFRLEGRVESAPLKGCSLNVPLTFKKGSSTKSAAVEQEKMGAACPKIPDDYVVNNSLKSLKGFLENPQTHALLSQCFHHKWVVDICLSDLTKCIPTVKDQVVNAFKSAFGSNLAAKNLLLILPNTHPIAGLEAIYFSLLFGLKTWVKVPKQYFSFIDSFIDVVFGQSDVRKNFVAVDPELRFQEISKHHPEITHNVIFGEDRSIRTLTEETNLHTQGFGSYLTISIIQGNFQLEQVANTLKDAFSLNQLGCMSSRLVLFLGKQLTHNLKHIQEVLHSESLRLFQGSIHPQFRDRLAHESIRLDLKDIRHDWTEEPTLPIFPVHKINRLSEIKDCFCHAPFALPLVETSQTLQLSDILPELKSMLPIKKVVTDIENVQGMRDLEITKTGLANQKKWDGTHEKRGLFRT